MGKLRRDLIFSIIGILIMFLGFLLPPFAGISKAGVIIIFIFAGALLLWTFVSGDWASILALVLIGLSGYYGAGAAGWRLRLSALWERHCPHDHVPLPHIVRRSANVWGTLLFSQMVLIQKNRRWTSLCYSGFHRRAVLPGVRCFQQLWWR